MRMRQHVARIVDVLSHLLNILNVAACLVSGARRHDHITPVLATTSLAASSSAGDLQDGGAGVGVSTRRSVT